MFSGFVKVNKMAAKTTLTYVLLISVFSVVFCEPALNANARPSKGRGFWNFLGLGKKEEPVYQMVPCAQTTTTQSPIVPMCPLIPVEPTKKPFHPGIGPPPLFPPRYPEPPPVTNAPIPLPQPTYPPVPLPQPTYPPGPLPQPTYPPVPQPPITYPPPPVPHPKPTAEPEPQPPLIPDETNDYPVGPLQSCAGIPVGPFVPPGFFLANNLYRQQQCMTQCTLRPSPQVMCNMMDVLRQLRLGTIYSLILQAGLEQLFTQTSNYTFFAPVDPSFEKLPVWFLQSLRDDMKLLRAFILNHFVKVDLNLESLGNEYLVMNARAGGNRLRVNVYNERSDYRVYTVDGARILLGDLQSMNGILHVVDKVLVPTRVRLHSEYLAEIQEFSMFLKAVMESGMLPMLSTEHHPITLFVPYNEAFKGFDYASISHDVVALKNLVKHHIINGTHYSNGLLYGQYLTTNYLKEIKVSVASDGFTKYANLINGDIKILKADIPVLNGVVHVIDTVLSYNLNFFMNFELSEYQNEFGSLRRGMSLNKIELEKEFQEENSRFGKNATVF